MVWIVPPQSLPFTTSTGCSNGTSPGRVTRIVYLPAESATWPHDVASVTDEPFVKVIFASQSAVPVSRSVTVTVMRS
jgi:hypothetical protein